MEALDSVGVREGLWDRSGAGFGRRDGAAGGRNGGKEVYGEIGGKRLGCFWVICKRLGESGLAVGVSGSQ